MDRFVGEADVFHATWYLLPRLRTPASVMTLHDLSFALFPETHLRVLRWSSNALVPRFLRACDLIIANSESTKRNAVRLYRILLPSGDPAVWAEAIARLTEEPALRRELRKRGFRQASRFRWEETARRTREVYSATHPHH